MMKSRFPPRKESRLVACTNSYEFYLANKKFLVDAEVFWKILDIYPRVQGEDYIEVLDDESTITFLIDLGYKGPLYKHPSMFVDHMHQPWRTLAANISKCLCGKSTSNDRLRKSKIDILCGMFYKENADYPKLIWEDFSFQINNRNLKKGRHKIMAYPARQVYATHERIVTESNPGQLEEDNYGLAFKDTSSVSKKMSLNSSQKLNGVPDESTVTPTTLSKGTGTKPGVPDEEKVTSEAKADVTLDWGSEEENEYTEEDDTDDEETDDKFVHREEHTQNDDEETDDEFAGDEQVNDEEMANAEEPDTGNAINAYLRSSLGDATQKIQRKLSEKEIVMTKSLQLDQTRVKRPREVEPKKEPVEKPAFKMASYDVEQAIDDVVNNANQPPDDINQTKDKALKYK
nr:hypothetical protein [Tanacetum cinerariifolium]